MEGIKTEITMPDGKKITVEVLEVRTKKEPTCKVCHKKIRFAQFLNGKQFPIMIDSETDQYKAHFNCKI